MSISVYVGHSGQRLLIDSRTTTTLDALRSRVAEDAGIQPRTQVLLTPQGKQAKAQSLLTEAELFVFDANLFNSAGPVTGAGTIARNHYEEFRPGQAPVTLNGVQDDLQSWQHLFGLRKRWADGVLSGCKELAALAEQCLDEQTNIERSVAVAVASLQRHVETAQQKHEVAAVRAQEELQYQGVHVEMWEQNLDSLRRIPARPEFARFLQPLREGGSRRLSQQSGINTLQAFVDIAKIRKAAGQAKNLTDTLAHTIHDLKKRVAEVAQEGDDLLRATEQSNELSVADSASAPATLLDEISVVVKKVGSDLTHVQSLPQTNQSVSQASKLALLHTRNFLPNLNEYCTEMNELALRSQEKRNSAADMAVERMQRLSAIESELAAIFSRLKKLEMADEEQQPFSTLNLISRLPSVYGQLLVESVRRREWVAKMKRDCSTLQEEVAVYQEEEEKRRRKWLRSVEDLIDPDVLVATKALGIELSLQNEGGSWPVVTRQELHDYLTTLLEVYGEGVVTADFEQSVKDLDKPTRKQIKHAKAFKNGSVHEAAFGDTSLLLRGDEQGKSLREANARLEEEVKAQKSRVRRLEDLLHRQNALSRNSNDLFGVPQDRSATSPTPSSVPATPSLLGRESSGRQRRLSSTAQQMEEKKLARRIVDLNAELQAAKEFASNLEKEANSRRASDVESQRQYEEALSTKKDLMENMEAQQKEFAEERRILEVELRKLKEHMEELEDELERVAGSRDNERTSSDERVRSLQEEVARLKDDAAGHAARAATAHDARNMAEHKFESADKARADLNTQIATMRKEDKTRQKSEADHMERLSSAFALLNPAGDAPSGLAALSAAFEELARRSAAHSKDLEEAVAFARSENESLRAASEAQKGDLAAAAQKQVDLEDELRRAQEQSSTEQAKATSLEEQLQGEQEQLRSLRDKFAEGETGSEVLRQRVAEEEARAAKMSQELAGAQSHINSLDVEIMRLQKKHVAYHASAEAADQRLEKRAERAKDVSQRLFAQNTRLSRLLERIGLAISYSEGGAMAVERASKLSASTITEPQGAMNRTVSLTSPPPTRKPSGSDDALPVSGLHWPDAQSANDETAQFDAYLQQISRFSIDTFSDAVVKRLRDFEYTAKKYNREAKEATKRADAYKERSSKLRTEAHAKIAVKDFKEGDLALFLPTRGQTKGAWAAFNIGCPHYFLAEKEGMRLGSRDFIVARISKVEQKVVDLSKSMPQGGRSIDEQQLGPSFVDDDNPFELSDGLTWWLVHAAEERGVGGVGGAAPTTPGLGKSTVAAANVDAKGSIRMKRSSKLDGASQHLNKSLDSRRSSSNSKKGVGLSGFVSTGATANGSPIARSRSESQTSLKPPPTQAGNSGGSPLGIVADNNENANTNTNTVDDAQRIAEQAPHPTQQPLDPVKAAPAQATAPDIRLESPTRPQDPPPRRRQNPSSQRLRSASPSKSVRSLQRHLDRSTSPVKGEGGGGGGGSMWNSLWQAEFKVESPVKK